MATDKHVLISYTPGDSPYARILAEDLERHGYSTWFEGRDARPGADRGKYMAEALSRAGAVAVLVSPALSHSTSILEDIEQARQAGIALFGVRLADIDTSHAGLMPIPNQDWYDGFGAAGEVGVHLMIGNMKPLFGIPIGTTTSSGRPDPAWPLAYGDPVPPPSVPLAAPAQPPAPAAPPPVPAEPAIEQVPPAPVPPEPASVEPPPAPPSLAKSPASGPAPAAVAPPPLPPPLPPQAQPGAAPAPAPAGAPAPPAGSSSKPLILIAVGLAAVLVIVLILYLTGVFGRRDSDPFSDEWPPSSSTGPRSSGTTAWPNRGTGSTAATPGSWLYGRWCSGADSITFGSSSWAMSSNRYGTYRLIGSQMTMTSPGGDSRIVTVLQIDSTTMTMSAPGQGSETLRRC
ncbi:MAG TPA: toll/interleukin-1 receptor domain-containing protein [Allosphingosinicella sp.]|nr:toll/interleukin-1 receptor domain-containing protein [Allosphingosinicella sp.]